MRTRGKGARHQLGPTLFSAAPSLPCFASYARSHSSHRLPARLKLLFKWALYCALYAICLLELQWLWGLDIAARRWQYHGDLICAQVAAVLTFRLLTLSFCTVSWQVKGRAKHHASNAVLSKMPSPAFKDSLRIYSPCVRERHGSRMIRHRRRQMNAKQIQASGVVGCGAFED